jgi:hypothetical protein
MSGKTLRWYRTNKAAALWATSRTPLCVNLWISFAVVVFKCWGDFSRGVFTARVGVSQYFQTLFLGEWQCG